MARSLPRPIFFSSELRAIRADAADLAYRLRALALSVGDTRQDERSVFRTISDRMDADQTYADELAGLAEAIMSAGAGAWLAGCEHAQDMIDADQAEADLAEDEDAEAERQAEDAADRDPYFERMARELGRAA